MRDAIVHLSWLLTHVARTLWGDHHTTGVVTALGEEVRVLQAELHRTHRILEGYSLIVEQGRDCHWAHRKSVQFFTLLFVVLAFLLWWTWNRKTKTLAASITARSVGDTGGSSDSDESAIDQKPLQALRVVQRGGSIARPSSFGKGPRSS